MTVYEKSTYSFVIRIWLEETATATKPALWRGHITHVMTGKERYFDDLQDILNFISQYVPQEVKSISELVGVTNSSHAFVTSSTLMLDQALIWKGIKMAEINWKMDLAITNGPKLSFDDKTVRDAFDVLEFTLEPGATNRKYELQPSNEAKDIYLIGIKRSPPPKDPTKPDTPKADPWEVTYKINDKDPAVPLENQHILAGHGVGYLLKEVPQYLTFSKEKRGNEDKSVTITVLVGRNAQEATTTEQKQP
jgi:hypothetical protein